MSKLSSLLSALNFCRKLVRDDISFSGDDISKENPSFSSLSRDGPSQGLKDESPWERSSDLCGEQLLLKSTFFSSSMSTKDILLVVEKIRKK